MTHLFCWSSALGLAVVSEVLVLAAGWPGGCGLGCGGAGLGLGLLEVPGSDTSCATQNTCQWMEDEEGISVTEMIVFSLIVPKMNSFSTAGHRNKDCRTGISHQVLWACWLVLWAYWLALAVYWLCWVKVARCLPPLSFFEERRRSARDPNHWDTIRGKKNWRHVSVSLYLRTTVNLLVGRLQY